MALLIAYLVILVLMFRIAEEQKKYNTNEELLAKSPWYYTFGTTTASYNRKDKPSLTDTPMYFFMVALAPLSIVILGLTLSANIVYSLIFKWVPSLFKKKTVQQ